MAKAKKKFIELEGDDEKVVFVKGRRALVYNRYDNDGEYTDDPADCDKNELIAAFNLTHVRAALKIAKGNQDEIDKAQDALDEAQAAYAEAQETLSELEDELLSIELTATEGGDFTVENKGDDVAGIGCSEVTTDELETIQDMLLG